MNEGTIGSDPTLLNRFLEKFAVSESGCWVWHAALDKDGYGKILANGKVQRAPRVSYQLFVGPIPAGLQVDHLCREVGCVNPTHLEVVSGIENRRRGFGFAGTQFRQRTCKYGHPLDDDNTYHWRGHRGCKECRRRRCRESYQRKVKRVQSPS